MSKNDQRPKSNFNYQKLDEFFVQQSKAFTEICKSYWGEVGEGAVNGINGGITTGMSYRAESGMMALHAILGTAWGLHLSKILAQGITALDNNDRNIRETAVEVRLFNKLMELQGRENSVEPIINAINGILEEKKAPALAQEIIDELKLDPQAKNFDNLMAQICGVRGREILTAVSILGIVSAAAGFTVMETYNNDLVATALTTAAATGASLSSGLLRASATSSADISSSTYNAIKNINEGIFSTISPSLVEEGKAGEIEGGLSVMRAEIRKDLGQATKPVTTSRILAESQIVEMNRV